MKINKSISLTMAFVFMLSSVGMSNAATKFNRISGDNRYQTSIKSQEYNKKSTVVFANGKKYKDILSALNLVNAKNASLILVSGYENMSEFIKKNDIKDVYIVGNEKEISDSFINNLKDSGAKINDRISGDDFEINDKTLKIGEFKDVAIASPDNYADTLSAFKLLSNEHLGIKLYNSKNDKISNEYNAKYTIGGQKSIPKTYGQRIGGSNRYDTSLLLSNKTKSPDIVFVSGNNFADAMSAVNVSVSKNADILLTPKSLDQRFVEKSKKANEIYVVGGEKELPSSMVEQSVSGKAIVRLESKNKQDSKVTNKITDKASNNLKNKTNNKEKNKANNKIQKNSVNKNHSSNRNTVKKNVALVPQRFINNKGDMVLEGVFRILTKDQVLKAQKIKDPNPWNPPTHESYAVLIFNGSPRVKFRTYDGRYSTRSIDMVAIASSLYNNLSKYVKYDGKKVRIKVNIKNSDWPSDTSLPLGAPSLDNRKIKIEVID